ncbi:TPA: hypothetical protein ACS7ZY_000506 [Providencia alcalifaciens]
MPVGIGKYHYGYMTFENFFGEEIEYVYIFYYQSNFTGTSRRQHFKEKFISAIPNQKVLEDIFPFRYELNTESSHCFWQVNLRTISGRNYETDGSFRCSIKQGDGGKVIMGVNGDSQSIYMNFSQSSDCSSHLFLLLD